jgi:protein-disulfide isomerase
MFITRLVFTTALSLTGLAALAGFSPLHLIAHAMAQSASDVAKPVSLPEMALGPADASVTITEYASMTCSHCAAFNANVFPKIKSEYIDTGKVRYVFREFPLDSKAAVASMLFAVIDMMFKKLDEWSLPADPLQGFLRVFATLGMSEESVETCLKDQALFDKLSADENFAHKVLKVNATPTFFINAERIKGAISFEEFDKRIKQLLMK